MSGIFRKRIAKTIPIGCSEPILAEREVSKDIQDDNGLSRTIVLVEKSDLSEIRMPSRDEYDLETMLNEGYSPQEINVKGMIASPYSESAAIEAFNSLQSQIDALNVSNVEPSKDE